MSQICRSPFVDHHCALPRVLPAARTRTTKGTIEFSHNLSMNVTTQHGHPRPADREQRTHFCAHDFASEPSDLRRAGKMMRLTAANDDRSAPRNTSKRILNTCVGVVRTVHGINRHSTVRIAIFPFSTLVFYSPEARLNSVRGEHRTRCLPAANLYCPTPALCR
jgi:hypothetical protein